MLTPTCLDVVSVHGTRCLVPILDLLLVPLLLVPRTEASAALGIDTHHLFATLAATALRVIVDEAVLQNGFGVAAFTAAHPILQLLTALGSARGRWLNDSEPLKHVTDSNRH
jgi:hypothetical protein